MSRRGHPASFSEIVVSAIRHRDLIWQLARRDTMSRYRGSMIGFAWALINPLLMLAVYTLFFTVALKARWGNQEGVSHGDFVLVLFVGLIVHGLFADLLARAPVLIVQNVNFVKKVVFPLEILPWVNVLSSLFNAALSTVALLVVQLVLTQHMEWTVIFFPLILVPYMVLMVGLSWILAALGAYVRDIVHVMGMVTTVLLFLSPVFYPVSSLPAKLQPWIMLNPLTFIIEQSRAVILNGELPDWACLGIYSLVSLLVARIGFWGFQKARGGFADVL